MSKRPKVRVVRTSQENNRNVSVFHILVNTNRVLSEDNTEEKMLYDLDKLGRHIDKFLKVVYDGPPMTGEEIIEFAYDVESGNKYKRLHGHVMVSVKHDTRIQIDHVKLKKWAKKYDYPNVHGKYINSQGDLQTILKRYSRKSYNQ